jgi:uncharacterized CHY-type Zn-finger protein
LRKTHIFDIAISCGYNCQSRYHISRILYERHFLKNKEFSIRENDRTNFDYGSFLWDWSVTPITSVIYTLQNNFSNVLLLENLSIEDNNNHQIVVDNQTGCLYYHTFKDTINKSLTYEKLQRQYPSVRAKINYLINKTKTTLQSEQKILFVLTGAHRLKDIKKLKQAILGYNRTFKILYTPWVNHKVYELFDGYKELYSDKDFIIKPILYDKYPGNVESWNDAFKDIHLALKTPHSNSLGE